MKLLTSLLDTVSALLESPSRRQDGAALVSIRRAMINMLPAAPRWDIEHVRQRISSAQDTQQLWFLRAEMNQVMCPVFGERQARALIEQLTPMFEGLIDEAFLHSHRRQQVRTKTLAAPNARASNADRFDSQEASYTAGIGQNSEANRSY